MQQSWFSHSLALRPFLKHLLHLQLCALYFCTSELSWFVQSTWFKHILIQSGLLRVCWHPRLVLVLLGVCRYKYHSFFYFSLRGVTVLPYLLSAPITALSLSSCGAFTTVMNLARSKSPLTTNWPSVLIADFLECWCQRMSPQTELLFWTHSINFNLHIRKQVIKNSFII